VFNRSGRFSCRWAMPRSIPRLKNSSFMLCLLVKRSMPTLAG
jgi:hypothetical protein